VAADAGPGEDTGPLLFVPAFTAGRAEVRWQRPGCRRAPVFLDPLGQHLHLVACQRAALLAGESRHWAFLSEGDGSPLTDDAQQCRLGNNGAEDRIVEGRRRTELAVGPMAAGATRLVQCREIHDLVRRPGAVVLAWPAGEVAAGSQEE